MASDGKWVTGLTAETPADDAARQVLAARLGVVKHYLPLAGQHAADDVEYVHQLRVATRRTGAALRTFKPVLSRKRSRQAKDVLRAVRQAAGAARDWDVFLETLGVSNALRAAGAEPTIDFLTGYALGERAAAQVTLARVAEACQPAVDEVCESVPASAALSDCESAPRTFGDLATDNLTGLFDGFAAAIAANPTTPHDLHQLRITGKRVRYAMEIFAGCFAAPFRDVLYPAVERVQEVLGTVQDGNVGLARVAAIRARVQATRPDTAGRVEKGLAGLERELRQSVRSEARIFKQWIRQWKKLTADHPLPELLRVSEPAAV